jgi:uncharacterized protein
MQPSPPHHGPIDRAILVLAQKQTQKPWLFVIASVVLTLCFAALASRLQLRTRFDQLLPENQPGVVELKRVESMTRSGQMMIVAFQGDDLAKLRQAATKSAGELRKLPPTIVTEVSAGVSEGQAFLKPRSGLFAKLPDLEALASDIDKRWDWEVTRATDNDFGESIEPAKITEETFRKRFGLENREDRFPDGYYQTKDGKTVFVVVRTPIRLGELEQSIAAKKTIEQTVTQAVMHEASSVRVGYTGDLLTGLAEYGRAQNDLLEVGALGIGLVLLSVLIYFMRMRALWMLGASITSGLAVTFGVTYLMIGHLNVATGFLFSIVAGNGINVGILYLARYYEERRNGKSAALAVMVTHENTWKATLLAALVSGAAYLSLSVSEFRAFRHFALIGASGMLICWVTTLLLLPALIILLDSKTKHVESVLSPPKGFAKLRLTGIPFGPFFVRLVEAAPRLWVGLFGVVLVVGIALGSRYVKQNPMEYDLRKTQNDPVTGSELYRLSELSKTVLGEYKSSMVVLCDTAEQARELSRKLANDANTLPATERPFEAAHSLFDFVPEDQEKKLEVLEHIRERLVRSKERGIVSDADWAKIQPALPLENLKTFGAADLPSDIALPFTDKAGKRGTLVLIEPSRSADEEDLRYLIRYADSFRETRLGEGKVVHGSGRATIFADILTAVVRDIPKALLAAIVLTFVSILAFIRKRPYLISVTLSLAAGLAGVAIYMALAKVKINFLNFAALPITLAIGADYSINVMQRYAIERSDDTGAKIEGRPSLPPSMPTILRTLRTTGGAVALCSLTTLLGYLALVRSENLAIASMGRLAVIGEISCLSAAVLALPAAWLLVERRK